MATHATLPKPYDFINDLNLKSGISVFKRHTDGRVVVAKHIHYAEWQDAVENGRPSFECEILERIGSHPNIVELVGIAWNYPRVGHKALIMEYCKGATCDALREHCKKNRKLVPPTLIWHCLLSVANASKHLTDLGIVNGDLYNLKNSMFCPKAEADPHLYPQLKLIDFGSATRFSDWFSFEGKETSLDFSRKRDLISFASAILAFFACNHLPKDLKGWLTRLEMGDFTWAALSEQFIPYAEEQIRANPHMPDWLSSYFQDALLDAKMLSNS